jgi:hypothetical protein
MPQLVRLNNGFVNVDSNAPGVSCFDAAGDSPEDQEPFGNVDLMQCLGVSSLPYPPDAAGHAEGILIEGIGGKPGIVVAAWDTRTFSLFGQAKPGDTILHSTGPNRAAQVLCKEEKRQVVLATKDEDGKPAMVVLDGKKQEFQFVGWGYGFKVSKKEGIVLEAGKARIVVSPEGIRLEGAITLGGQMAAQPPGMCMAVGTVASWAAITAMCQAPLVPIPNAMGAL